MAETMRSITTLETLLADNATKQVSPQDLRDAVLATIIPGYAQMYISSPLATDVSVVDTWYEVSGTYTLNDNTPNWSMGTNGRLQYDGPETREVMINASISMTVAASNEVLEFAVAKNGTISTPSIVRRKVSVGSDVGAAAIVAHVEVGTSDYISLFCRNTDSASDITADLMDMVVMDFPA